MTKYAANSMMATKISFMNDMANLCEIDGADVNMVRKGIGSDASIGNKFIYPGICYGDSCFPKDVKALIKTASENGNDMQILQAVEAVNEYQKTVLFQKISNRFLGDLFRKTFAIWGLSFNPNIDDMRETPSLVIIDCILNAGGFVKVCELVAMSETRHVLGDSITYCENEYEALEDAEALLVVT